MYCWSCGAELTPNAAFCQSCGTKQGRQPAEATPAGEAEMTTAGQATMAPAKKKMALWKKIALGFVGFLVIVVSLALFLTAGLTEPIERQLAAIKVGDVDAAYAETSIVYRKTTSKEAFAAFLEANPALAEVTDHSFTSRERKNAIGTVKGTLKTKDGGVLPVEYRLVEEDGQWKILSIKLGGG